MENLQVFQGSDAPFGGVDFADYDNKSYNIRYSYVSTAIHADSVDNATGLERGDKDSLPESCCTITYTMRLQ